MSFSRPTGRLEPAPADLAYGSLELAALEYQARRGEIILLYEDETILWRFALLRAGWWRTTQRARIPTRPLSPSQIKRDESLKRHAWVQYRSWSRITSGVLLSIIGAVQYGTSKVFYKIVPHFDPSLTVARYMILRLFISMCYRCYPMYLGCLFCLFVYVEFFRICLQ